MADHQLYEILEGGLISSTSSLYRVHCILGHGSFGTVAQCHKFANNEIVALKINKNERHTEQAKTEEKILRQMKELNSDKFNIVRWTDSFFYGDHYCLEFEKLDINLFQFMETHRLNCLELKEIRPIMHQLATALQFLKSAGIVHADLKPENIMMVDHVEKPLKIKVIDFGLAHSYPKLYTGNTLQSLWYRAPEVLLGAPYSEAIDVWSLGCIGAELLMGEALFPCNKEYDMMRHFVYTLGKPPDDLLDAGLYTAHFFHRRYTDKWRFMAPFEVGVLTCTPHTITNLSDLVKASRKPSEEDARADTCDIESYVDLLTRMLQTDLSKRITPSQILQHPFVTMSHFDGMLDSSLHVKLCFELMASCQDLSSGDDQDVAQETSSSNAGLEAHHDEGHPAGPSDSKQASVAVLTENRLRKKRKKDDVDEPECGNTPDPIPPIKNTGGQTNPPKSPLQKRQSDEADSFITSEGKSPEKSVELKKELLQNLKKLLNPEAAQSNLTQVSHVNKRKRADDDEEEEKKGSPCKTRRRCRLSRSVHF